MLTSTWMITVPVRRGPHSFFPSLSLFSSFPSLSLFSSFPPFPPIPPFWKQFSFFFVSFLKSLPIGEGRTKSPSTLCLHVTSIYLCRRRDATCIPRALLSIWGCYLTRGGWAASPNLRLQCPPPPGSLPRCPLPIARKSSELFCPWGMAGYLLLFSRSFVADSLWFPGLQHARLPYSSLSPRVCSDSYPLSW